jgi:ribosomal protein S27AE
VIDHREPPLHRPRPCSRCGIPSTAIVDGACLGCRTDAPPQETRPRIACTGCGQALLLTRPGRVVCARCELDRKESA